MNKLAELAKNTGERGHRQVGMHVEARLVAISPSERLQRAPETRCLLVSPLLDVVISASIITSMLGQKKHGSVCGQAQHPYWEKREESPYLRESIIT